MKRKLFADMDGVIVDFDGYMQKHKLTADEVKKKKGAYLEMEPIPGALEAIKKVMEMGFDVWIATKPPTGVSHAYSDKAEWIFKHIPELKNKIIITHHKGLLGDENDILCDDRPHKAFCNEFKGVVIPFVDGYHWNEALLHLACLPTEVMSDMVTVKDIKNGKTIGVPIYQHNPYIVVKNNLVVAAGTMDEIKLLSSYYDDIEVQVRSHDLYLNNNKKIKYTKVESGKCRICGCIDDDCTQCIEKTGMPCYWVDEAHTLCSACQ